MTLSAEVVFRVNHIGYGAYDKKYGFLCQFGSEEYSGKPFTLMKGGEVVYSGTVGAERPVGYSAFDKIYVCDFSSVNDAGTYTLQIEGVASEEFTIGSKEAYKSVLNTLLDFYQSQRCGSDDALLHDACHLNDKNAAIDCSGGWHDAGDYIKFMITGSYVALEMLTTVDYMSSYGMKHALIDERGESGIPDLLEESRIGAEWILKMTSDVANKKLYFQVSGKEDHKYWRIPEQDDITGNVGNPRALHEGWGQNLTGRSVAVLVYSSILWREYDEAFADKCMSRALEIWEVRNEFTGVQKSEPDDFYGEWTTTDDLLMAAVMLYRATGDDTYKVFMKSYYSDIKGYYIGWGNIDYLAVAACYRAGYKVDESLVKMEYILDYRAEKMLENPFYRSSGLVWGTNAEYTSHGQIALIHKMVTGSDKYLRVAQYQRDYLLGANNWGLSFIVGVGHRFPMYSHSQLNDLVDLHKGAVVGGPASKTNWEKILNLPSNFSDPYEKYQGESVYYDWLGDYYSNEVAIDYAAAALFIMTYYYGDVDGTTAVVHPEEVQSQHAIPLSVHRGTLKVDMAGVESVAICDLRGRILHNLALTKRGSSSEVALPGGISTGIYLIQIKSSEQQFTQRVYLP